MPALPLLTSWRVTLWGNLGGCYGMLSSIPGPSPTVVIATSQTSQASPSVPGCRIACYAGLLTLCICTKALGLEHLQGTWRFSPSAPRRSDPRPGWEANARPVSSVQPAQEPPWTRRPPAPW